LVKNCWQGISELPERNHAMPVERSIASTRSGLLAMRRAFGPPYRTRKPARSSDDSLAQSCLHSEQGRERRAAGDLGHFLLELDDTISDFLARVDSDARELPRGTAFLRTDPAEAS
jgi:hypothetical protein